MARDKLVQVAPFFKQPELYEMQHLEKCWKHYN